MHSYWSYRSFNIEPYCFFVYEKLEKHKKYL